MKNGIEILVDSNIFIYWLNGDLKAAEIPSENTIFYSVITEIEVKGHTTLLDSANKAKLDKLFNRFQRVELTSDIKDLAIQYKIDYKLKTPDAIICASSRRLKIPLLTADKKILTIDKIVSVFFSKI